MKILNLLGFLLFTILNFLDRLLWHLKVLIDPPPPKESPTLNIEGIQVTDPKKGETGIYRHPSAKDEFITTFKEGVHTMSSLWNVAVSEFKDLRCMASRRIIKKHFEKVVVDGKEKIYTIPEFSELKWKTFREADQIVKDLGAGLVQLTNLKSKDLIGIFEDTREEWFLTYHAAQQFNLTVVTVYANLGMNGLFSCLKECDLTTLFTNAEYVPEILKNSDKFPKLKYIIYYDDLVLDETTSNIQVYSYEQVIQYGKKHPRLPKEDEIPTKDDISVIMYTSGSTGEPKGCMLSHDNMVSLLSSVMIHVLPALRGPEQNVYIAYLPLAHILELQAENMVMFFGGCVGYGNPRTLVDRYAKPVGDFKAIRPNFMTAVPRVLDTVRKVILEKLENQSSFVQWLFKVAYEAKLKAVRNWEDTPLWNLLVFNQFAAEMGGRVAGILCGGAALSKETHEFFRVCFGCPIVQGYGMTETNGGISIQDYYNFSFDNVGGPIPSLEVKLVDVPEMGYLTSDNPPKGEIVVRGANVFVGYYKKPELTKESFKDGWFHTGDIGQLEKDGSFRIIDRMKNLIKMAHGEYVALSYLESLYCQSPFIAPNGIMVYGDEKHDFLLAIAQPQKSYIREWCKKNSIKGTLEEVVELPELERCVLQSLDEIAERYKLKTSDKIKKIKLVTDEWTPENGLMTAALKLKRANVIKKYKDLILEMYGEK